MRFQADFNQNHFIVSASPKLGFLMTEYGILIYVKACLFFCFFCPIITLVYGSFKGCPCLGMFKSQKACGIQYQAFFISTVFSSELDYGVILPSAAQPPSFLISVNFPCCIIC